MTKSKSLNQLIEAVIENNPRKVNTILSTGINPNLAEDKAGITPLHYAAQNDALLVIPLLIEAGANIHAETKPEGHTPLDIALLHGHGKVAQTLLAYANQADAQEH